jgi:hypothetical protein
MSGVKLIPSMSFFIGQIAVPFQMTSKRRAHLPDEATGRYVRPVWRSSEMRLNGRGGVMEHFRSIAVSAALDRSHASTVARHGASDSIDGEIPVIIVSTGGRVLPGNQ